MAGARIEFVGVSGQYGDVVALQETNLTIEPGEFFALLGPSGSGKSTLLGSVTGFVAPRTGRVLIDGHDITGIPPYRRNIGMVFQNYALFPFMTVYENVAFPLETRRIPKSAQKARIEKALAMVRLTELAHRLPRHLSGGQQQRVALARAAIYDPPVLLMDEPLGALDKNLREDMQDELRLFHRQVGATIIYVTHDQHEAAALADRVAILNHGRLEQIDTPRQLYEHPCNAFVAGFLGEANMFSVTTVRTEGEALHLGTREGLALRARCGSASGERIACVRPERIVISAEPDGDNVNQFAGVVREAVFSTGSIRYRVDVQQQSILVRVGSLQHGADFVVGASVYVSWSAADTLLLAE